MKEQKPSACPVCGMEIRNPANLKRHLKARHADVPEPAKPPKMRFPGASHDVGEAPLPVETRESHELLMLFDHLATQAGFPCTCSACCIRAIIGFFLPELLKTRFNGDFKAVVSGFPIMKKKAGKGSCIEFVLFRTGPQPEWWFVDLVFQPEELRPKRLARYRRACAKGMPSLLKSLGILQECSTRDQKRAFRNLIRVIRSHDTTAPIQVAVVAPGKPDHLDLEGIRVITWEELSKDPQDYMVFRLLDLVRTQLPADSLPW